jgi:hypothetical protein
MILLLLIGGYAVGISVAVVAVYRSRADSEALDAELLSLARQDGPIKERAEILHALAEVRNSQIRWYERAISTVGIVALITMTIATAVQTVQSAAQEKKLEEWERRSAEAERRVGEANWLIGSMAKLLVNRATRVALLSDDEKRILRYRFERLSEMPKLERAEQQEMIQLAIVLREFFRGAALIEKDASLFDSADVADHVSLAEYYYLTGALDRARAISYRISPR